MKKPRRYLGLPIHRKNYPLLELGDDHPAIAALVAHGECRRFCGGREIRMPGGPPAADQSWHSEIDGRDWKFSTLFYTFISFDLVLDEWMSHPPSITPQEIAWQEGIPKMRTYWNECEAAARQDRNEPVLEMLQSVKTLLDAWERAIAARIEKDVVA
jgi:hypothetical protein